MKSLFTFFSIFCLCYSLWAQEPVQIKDINPDGSSLPFSNGNLIAEYGGILYFAADDETHGIELWRTDGTEDGTYLVKDINEGDADSECGNFYFTNGHLLFTADDGTNGVELWRTDGSESGTVMVKDIWSGIGGSIPSFTSPQHNYLVWQDVLYFSADDGINGIELWRTDGTEAGTSLVKNIGFSGSSSNPRYFAEHDGLLYFTAFSSGNQSLWASDGTEGGTNLVGAVGASPTDLVSCNGLLLFIGEASFANRELWRSDGTDAGTYELVDIDPSGGGLLTQPNTSEKRLVKIGNTIFFSADDGTNGRELWRSDGTESGTMMVKDASSLTNGVAPQNFAIIDDLLYYKFDDGQHGIELWRSDGTESGTFMVKDITDGFSGSFVLPTYISAVGGKLFFGAANGSSFDIELWESDGTEPGTYLVDDINPNGISSSPQRFIQYGDDVVFMANSPDGYELWKYTLFPAPLPLSADIQVTNGLLCFGDSDGALEVSVSGGVPPYGYEWQPAINGGPAPTELFAGTYNVTVSDDMGTMVTLSIELTEPPMMGGVVNSSAEINNGMNGTAQILMGGGTPPYSYLWSNGDTESNIENLDAGDYLVTVTDANGCVYEDEVTVDLFNPTHDIFSTSITVSPTIVTNGFTIQSDQLSHQGLQVFLSSQNGKLVKEWKRVASGEWLEIQGIPNGVYFVRTTIKNRSFIEKIIIKNN